MPFDTAKTRSELVEEIARLTKILAALDSVTGRATKTTVKKGTSKKSYKVGQNGPIPAWIVEQESLQRTPHPFHKLVGKYGKGHIIKRKK